MFMIIYLIAVMILTPIVYDHVNRVPADNRVTTYIRGLPSYVINLIICGVEALIGLLVIPSNHDVNLWNVLIFTALIYLGNQMVFNFAVKIYSKARNTV